MSRKAPASHVAPHAVGPAWDSMVKRCEEDVARSEGPHCITHITSGVQDFVVHAFDDPQSLPARVRDQAAQLRDDCSSIARLISHFTMDQDRKLDEIRTGSLIRMVLHAEGGAVFCFSVVPGEYVVSFRFSSSLSDRSAEEPPGGLSQVSEIESVDIAMTTLIRDLRREIGLPPENPGARQEPSEPTHRMASTTPESGSNEPNTEGNEEDLLRDLSRDLVHPAHLHYVSRCLGKNRSLTVDYFGDDAVSRFFRGITIDARRKFYADYALELRTMVSQLSRQTRGSVGGGVQRLVLDVQLGAIYYYRLETGDYLVGVTLDQDQVKVADDNMALLARRFAERLQAK